MNSNRNYKKGNVNFMYPPKQESATLSPYHHPAKPNSSSIVPLYPNPGSKNPNKSNQFAPKPTFQNHNPQRGAQDVDSMLPFSSNQQNKNVMKTSSVAPPAAKPVKKKMPVEQKGQARKKLKFEDEAYNNPSNFYYNTQPDFAFLEKECRESNSPTRNYPTFTRSSEMIDVENLRKSISKVVVPMKQTSSRYLTQWMFPTSVLATLEVEKIVREITWADDRPVYRLKPSLPLDFVEILGLVKQVIKKSEEHAKPMHLLLVNQLNHNCKKY